MILVTVKPAWLLLVRGEFGENIFIILLNLQNEQMFLCVIVTQIQDCYMYSSRSQN